MGVGRAKVLRYGGESRIDDKAVTDEFVTRHTLGRHPVQPKPPLDVRAVCAACVQPYLRPPGQPGDRLVSSNVASRNVLPLANVSMLNFDDVTDASGAAGAPRWLFVDRARCIGGPGSC